MRAAPYMQILIDFAVRHNCDAPETDNAPSEASHDPASVMSTALLPAAAQVVLSHLVWLSILAMVTATNAEALLGIEHIHLLDSGIIRLEEIGGCTVAVAKAMCQVSSLARWRYRSEQENRLNILELGTRAQSILEALEEEIAQMVDEMSSEHDGDGEKMDISRLVFARAAVVYLHAITSGPNPRLEEVKTQISELVKLCESFQMHGVVLCTPWPLCVTACLAQEEQMEVLARVLKSWDGLHSRARGNTAPNQILTIMRECHMLREMSQKTGRNHNWGWGAEQLGKVMLLT